MPSTATQKPAQATHKLPATTPPANRQKASRTTPRASLGRPRHNPLERALLGVGDMDWTLPASPYCLGQLAADRTRSLKGMPYGPGPRQDACIQGFADAIAARVG